MRIGIDCRLWNETGVGRYIRNLVIHLSVIDKKNEYVLFTRTQDEKTIKSIIKNSNFIVCISDIPWHGVLEQVRFPKILNEQNLDLMHFPYFSVPIFYNKPFVVTIHDLIVNRFNTGRASTLPLPLYYAKRIGYHAVMSNAVYRSKKIIVPSNAVRNDLLKSYINTDHKKVEVTYEGGFEDKRQAKSEKPIVEGRYILRVGNFYPHKNVEGLLLAFRGFLYDNYENHDVKLILVGKKDYFFKKIEKLIEKINIGANCIFFENTTDDDLVSLYSHAIATIIPSFSEGFSLTSVEALDCGSLVIASDIPVHREVCGSAAIYCNPNNLNDIKQKITFACSLIEESKKELIEQGKKHVKRFSWNKMASQTLSIYDSI